MKDKQAKKLKKRASDLLATLAKELADVGSEKFKAKFTGDQLSQLLGCVQHKIDWVKSKPLDKKKGVNEANAKEADALTELRQAVLEVLVGK